MKKEESEMAGEKKESLNNEINKIRIRLANALNKEKNALIAGIAGAMGLKLRKGYSRKLLREYSCAIGDIDLLIGCSKINVAIHVNCSRAGRLNQNVGYGNGLLSCYLWIPIVCRYEDEEKKIRFIRNYNLALNQQDLDWNTGNFHTVFGVVQLWKGLEESSNSEVGGETNDKGDMTMRYDGSIEMVFNAQKGFPPAVRTGTINGANVTNPGKKPWGIDYTKKQTLPKIPETFDMGNDNYDTDAVAKFAAALIKLDLERELEKELKELYYNVFTGDAQP